MKYDFPNDYDRSNPITMKHAIVKWVNYLNAQQENKKNLCYKLKNMLVEHTSNGLDEILQGISQNTSHQDTLEGIEIYAQNRAGLNDFYLKKLQIL